MSRSIKAELIEIAQNLPEDCTYEDMQYQLYVRTKIQRGIEEAQAGHVVPHEEVKQRFAERWAAK
ncbi:hypothetical protein [Panacagrimonas sp.]|uniref:hypothetical protein n=1 Tax=Panacagrimonas sp. TaxID=2480088 RepID=UPI003B52B009